MPRDPLAAVADRFVPERTNFFDPAPGQSIIARYGNAGIGMDDSERAAESAIRLRRSREDRLSAGGRALTPFEQERQERQRALWRREDQEYDDQKRVRESRGEFLDAVSKLDPEADDYEDRRTKMLSELPTGVSDDDGFKDILSFKDRVAGERRSASRQDEVYKRGLTDRNESSLKRAMARAAEAGLPPEKFPRDAEGNIDADELSYLAGSYKREHAAAAKEASADARNREWDRRHEITSAEKVASSARANKDAMQLVTSNADVFPSQMSSLRAANPKRDDAWLKKNKAKEYGDAMAYDRDQYDKEIGSAFNAASEDAYVNLVPGLSEAKKGLRRKIYQAAKDAMGGSDPGYGNRPDGTAKGKGWLGELKLPDGSVATEYTMQSDAVQQDGKRIDFPTLVPTLSKDEVDLMVNDIIPNKKEIPESIIQKAIGHAKERLGAGKSVFADETKTLDRAGAAALLKEAGGDKEKARQLARERGLSF